MLKKLKNFFFNLINIEKKEFKYNNRLIKTLIKQHKELFKSYTKILNNAKKKKYEKVIENLEEFEKMYTTHILIEDNKLYTYLEKNYKNNDQEKYQFIQEKQANMKQITKDLLNFIEKYKNENELKNNIEKFIKNWEEIGKLLTIRIKMEENNLYILYKNVQEK